ncbi:hypothetical protein JGUZn3_10300 [Entomobacter blattae]|uniref:Radical SAM core domain-containing protein n=1 Tax=Entomobacter blattae TaxID=2762277 RepID=A0A7H1NR48_9PROT|nr:hypothetical protein JGUZn3_10300 [Entomobacter blattae]
MAFPKIRRGQKIGVKKTGTKKEATDPIGDERFSPPPGIVHRYKDRALLKPIHICPLYCRFCFRREKVGPNHGLLTDDELDNALEWIARHPDISEIILTGGDPLMLPFRRLKMIHGERRVDLVHGFLDAACFGETRF